ncbi:MAG: signal recognition particle-docking protein FtsY [SAR324 cluster bacterium]|jgi:fused signal recognition particle receptor|nr:signal recognition particle-docking protein FtsY [SAR324 cluster bacterium]
MFAEELKQLFFPFLEEVNFLFSRIFNKGVPISNEMTIFIFAVCIALLFIFIFSMWFLLRRKSRNEKDLEQTSSKIKKKSLEHLKKERDKELDLRIKEEKKLQERKQVTQLEKVQQHEKVIQDQIASLEEQKQSIQVLQRDLTDAQKPPEKLGQSDSFLDRLRNGVDKTRNHILNNLSDAVLGKKEINDELLDDLEEVLISSDIGPETTQRILEAITKKVERDELNNPQVLQSEIEQEILRIMSKKYQAPGTSDRKPLILLFVGVNGVGKTTSIGKIAAQYRQQGKKVLMGAGDTFRAAAIEQLAEWSKRADCDIVHKNAGTDPSAVIFESVQKGIDDDYDVVICDTAGRLHTKKNLMEELKKMVRVIRKLIPDAPHEVLLVLDATTGQNAIFQTREFLQAAELTGFIITKLDGTSKGGVVIGIVNEFDIPVRYIGLGEQIDDLRPFDAQQFTKSIFA